MSDTQETQYLLGGMAVSTGILTQEQYEACYYEHASHQSHMSFEDYMLSAGILSQEQVDYLKNATNTYYQSEVYPEADTGEPAAEPMIMEIASEPAVEQPSGGVSDETKYEEGPVPGYEALDAAEDEIDPEERQEIFEDQDVFVTEATTRQDAFPAPQPDIVPDATIMEPVQPAADPADDEGTDPDIQTGPPADAVPEATMMAPVQPQAAEDEQGTDPHIQTGPPEDFVPEATMMAPVQPDPEPEAASEEMDWLTDGFDLSAVADSAAIDEEGTDPDIQVTPPADVVPEATMMEPVQPASDAVDDEGTKAEIPAALGADYVPEATMLAPVQPTPDPADDEGTKAEIPAALGPGFVPEATINEPVQAQDRPAVSEDSDPYGATMQEPVQAAAPDDPYGATIQDAVQPADGSEAPTFRQEGSARTEHDPVQPVQEPVSSHTEMTIDDSPGAGAMQTISTDSGRKPPTSRGSGTSLTSLMAGPMAGAADDLGAMQKYELMDEVARGGMGVIYKARQKDLNRIVALKVMLSGAMASEGERKRFLREAEACANLHHPNIISVYEIGLFNENYFFSMDYIDGVSLVEYVKREEDAFTDRKKVDVMIKVLDAIHYGHENGIVHRDLKPANIMMDQHEEPIVMDFGLVKVLQSEDEDELSLLTATGAVMGTPHYMAPEQAAGKVHDIGACTDIFALGIIIYELFTGVRPFTGNNVNEIFNAIFNLEPEAPTKANPKLDWEIEAIILKALEKEPEKRYVSALDMKQDFERFRAGEPIQAKKISQWYYIKKKIKRHKAIVVLLIVVLMLILGGTGYGVYSYYQKLNQAAFDRALEEKQLVHLDQSNEKLLDSLNGLLAEGDFTQARETKEKIRASWSRMQDVINNSKVGAEDPNNYIRLWEAEIKQIEDTIAKEELRAQQEADQRLSHKLTLEGNAYLKKAEQFLKAGSQGDNRSNAKKMLARAKRRYSDALARHEDNQNARIAKFKTCIMMGYILIEDKDFGYSAEDNLEEAAGAAVSEEEKAALKKLHDSYEYEKNEMAVYEQYFKEAQKLFAAKDYKGALANYETARQYSDSPAVQEEIKKTNFRIELEKADVLRDKNDFFLAASAYRVALGYAMEDAEKANTKQSVSAMIEKGVALGITKVESLIEARDLDAAETEIIKILEYSRQAEAVRLKNLIAYMKAVPANMVFIEGGEFQKGTPEKRVGNPQGKAELKGFYISRYEVTNFQYKKFVDEGGYDNQAFWSPEGWKRIKELVSIDGNPGPFFWIKGSYSDGADDLPVAGISIFEAEAYAKWLSQKRGRVFKLPSELQWEKAASWDARNNRRLAFPWGSVWDARKGNFGRDLKKIGGVPTDKSPYGCFDMAGNLHEWAYNTQKDGPVGVLKGGAAKLPGPLAETMARASYREAPMDGFRGERVGFRIISYPHGGEE